MKRTFLFGFIFLLLTGICQTSFTDNAECTSYGFCRLAFVKIDDAGNLSAVNEKQIDLPTGKEKLLIQFFPLKNSYIYLILSGPGDKVVILFPSSLKDFSTQYLTFKKEITVLEESAPPGLYELNILISSSRLFVLEKIFNAYRGNTQGKIISLTDTDAKRKLDLTIKKLKRQVYFTSSRQTVFSGEAGVKRTAVDEIELLTERIDFRGLYADTYIIEKK